MPLIGINHDVVPKPTALFWQMSQASERVQVYVNRTALNKLRNGQVGDLAIFQANRIRLENIASKKFDRDGRDGLGNVAITAEDLLDPQLND